MAKETGQELLEHLQRMGGISDFWKTRVQV